jgi:EmrB/QacA subfamily drug resistance transporter
LSPFSGDRLKNGQKKGIMEYMSKQHTKEQNGTLLVSVTTAFISTFMGSALNLSIPSMGEHFGVSATLVGWVVTAYMLAVAAMSVPMGKIADTYGRKPILIWGVFAFSMTGLLAVLAWNIWAMIIFRIAQGIAGAMIFSTNTAILISVFPPDERGKVLGKLTASTYLGLSIGPVVGGIMNHYFGWQSIFAISSVVGFVAFTTAFRRLPRNEVHELGTMLDLTGMTYYVIMIVMTLYGLSNVSSVKFAWIFVIGGILVGVLFVRRELKIDSPMLQLRIFINNLVFTFSNVATLLNYGATFAVGYLLSIYLQLVMGYSSQIAGIILVCQPIVMAIFSPFAGRLSDRISPHKIASLGMAICALNLFLFAFINEETPLWVIIGGLLFIGLGFALFSSPNTNAVMACVDKQEYSIASSILATMRSIGHSSSMAIVTVVIGAYMGNIGLADATTGQLVHTMHTAFSIFTVLCLVGIPLSLSRGTNKIKNA